MFHVPEKYRIKDGRMGSTSEAGNNGAFDIVSLKFLRRVHVIASDGMGWEHVSVSLQSRIPTWSEMCAIKAMFWDKEDCVIQYHPADADYVNVHEFCLHLWRPTDVEIPTPPTYMIG